MKKLLLYIVAAGLVVSCANSANIIKGSNKSARGDFDIDPNYTELDVATGIKVILDPTLGRTGTIVADEKVLDYVAIVQKDGRVSVRYEPGVSISSSVKTVVTIPQSRVISALRAASSGSIEAETQILAHGLTIEGSSSAYIKADVEARDLTVRVSSSARCDLAVHCGVCKIYGSSSGRVDCRLSARELSGEFSSSSRCTLDGKADYASLKASSSGSVGGRFSAGKIDASLTSSGRCGIDGQADRVNITASSSGRFEGDNFECRKADIEAASSGVVRLGVSEELGVSVSSGASVRYRGEPRLTRHNVSSGGSLKRID